MMRFNCRAGTENALLSTAFRFPVLVIGLAKPHTIIPEEVIRCWKASSADQVRELAAHVFLWGGGISARLVVTSEDGIDPTQVTD